MDDDYFADLTRRNRRLFARLAESPSVEITGLVGPNYASGGKLACEERSTLHVGLDAWRVDGGWMRTKPLSVRREIEEDELTHWIQQFGIEQVVRFRGRLCDDPEFGGANVLLEEFLARDVADEELNAHLRYLQTPIVRHDRVLGELTWNRKYGWFEGKAIWNGRRAKVRLSTSAPESFYAVKDLACKLWDDEDSLVPRIEQCVLAELLELKNDTWLEDGEKPLTAKQFLRRMVLESITVQEDGGWYFWYDDGYLFWGHSIRVAGTLADGPKSVTIEG